MSQEMDELQLALQHYWRRYRGLIIVVFVLVPLIWLASSMYYTVRPQSRGVVLRLGKPLDPTPPGLHFKAPWPIDKVTTVPVERVQSIEFGYRTLEAGRRTRYAAESDNQKTMARMLTADLNLAHVEWAVQYRIKDPNQYLFKVGGEAGKTPTENVRDLISDVSEAVMRRIVGDVSVDSAITIGRQKIADDAMKEMQLRLDEFEAGIHVVKVLLQSATPPEPVKDAFDAVNRAKQTKETIVNTAKGERNTQLPRARGLKDRKITEAEGYALRIQMTAEGQANAFLSKLAEYEKAPAITKIRLYIEAMEEILAQVDEKIVIDESVKGMLPLLHLDAGGTQTGSAGTRAKGGVR